MNRRGFLRGLIAGVPLIVVPSTRTIIDMGRNSGRLPQPIDGVWQMARVRFTAGDYVICGMPALTGIVQGFDAWLPRDA